MMGQLARTDAYYDPFSDSAVTPPEPQIDPRNITAGWAAIAAAHPQPFEPQGTRWPDPNAPPPKQPSSPLDPGYQWSIGQWAAPFHGATQAAGETAGSMLLPNSRLGMVATSMVDADPADARWIKYPFNRIGVGDTIANLAKQNQLVRTKDIFEKTIQPHDIPEGSWLTPLVGDRSRSGELLMSVGDKDLRDPVWMQGGYQFTPEWADRDVAWGSDRSPSSTIAGRIKGLQKEGTGDVYGVYTPMTPLSVDASHHMSDTLSQMMHLEKKNISKTAAEQFDAKFDFDPNFPGVKSPKLQDYLRQQSMSYRDNFAKTMNTRAARDAGFPDVEQARIAVTHPSLLDTPNYAGGQSIARMTGDVVHGSTGFGLAPHYTYRSKLPGDYVGGLPGPLPQELLWRDLAPKIAARDPSAVGKIWLTMLKGEKPGQLVDRQWQDAAAEYFRKNPMGSLANTGSYQP